MGGVRSDLVCMVYTEYRCCLCAKCSVIVMTTLKIALPRMAVTVVVQCENAFVICYGSRRNRSSIYLHQFLYNSMC